MDDDGEVDFFDERYTQERPRGLQTSTCSSRRRGATIGTADFLLVLNRNENSSRRSPSCEGAQAAAYFMLGETKGTSAGGADEAGKFLRVPGTNPFFPLPHDLQGNRFLDLLSAHPIEVYLMTPAASAAPRRTSARRR